jgi:hypothetical protein
VLILLFVLIYKIGDAMGQIMLATDDRRARLLRHRIQSR